MRAKDFLQQIEKLELMIENKKAEKIRWKDIASNITSSFNNVLVEVKPPKYEFRNGMIIEIEKGKYELQGMDRVQSSGNPQKMENAVDEFMNLDEEIIQCEIWLIECQNEITRTIELLSPTEYDLLHKVYIQKMSLSDVGQKRNKSYSWAKAVHGSALKNLQIILDEKEKKNS